MTGLPALPCSTAERSKSGWHRSRTQTSRWTTCGAWTWPSWMGGAAWLPTAQVSLEPWVQHSQACASPCLLKPWGVQEMRCLSPTQAGSQKRRRELKHPICLHSRMLMLLGRAQTRTERCMWWTLGIYVHEASAQALVICSCQVDWLSATSVCCHGPAPSVTHGNAICLGTAPSFHVWQGAKESVASVLAWHSRPSCTPVLLSLLLPEPSLRKAFPDHLPTMPPAGSHSVSHICSCSRSSTSGTAEAVLS